MATPITPYSGTAPNPFTQTQPEFDANTQAWVDFTTRLPDEINQFAEDLGTANTNSTSVTSLSIGTGSKSLVVDAGKTYFEGQSVTIARTAAPTNRMFAVVDSYNSGTGALVVTSQAFEGSGTFTDWTITLGFNGVISTEQIEDDAVTAAKLNADVFASSAENEAGTVEGKAVDPLGIREAFNATGSAPVYACRAWVNFNGTGTVAIRASGNVSSITDNNTGDYTINFTTAMQDANYCFTLGGERETATVANTRIVTAKFGGIAASSLGIRSEYPDSGAAIDLPTLCVAIFR